MGVIQRQNIGLGFNIGIGMLALSILLMVIAAMLGKVGAK